VIEKTIHIGPVFDGGMGSVIQGYIKLFGLPKENAWNSYRNGFLKSLPCLFAICFKVLFIRQKEIVCYHLHSASRGSMLRKLIIALCLKLRDKKIIVHLHGGGTQKFYTQGISTKILLWTLIKISNAVICITEQMKNFIKKERLKCRIFLIPNLCETIMEKSVDLAHHQEPVKIVYCGTFVKNKGFFDLIEAFEKAKFEYPVILDLFGNGIVPEIEKRNINIRGWVEHSEYLKLLPDYDFFVLPSYVEVFPMSILEAMGVGLPIIGTYAGGMPEMIENGKTGILFKAGDINELTAALEKLANDKNLRVEFGKNAWIRANNKYAPQLIQKLLEEIYSCQKLQG